MISNHTINSGIIRDILAALAQEGMERKYIGGGIGVQFVLPQELHRFTSDVDMESCDRTTSGSFHDYIVHIGVPLTNRGYSIEFEKQRGTYDAELFRDQYKAVIQIPRRSVKKFEEVKKKLERECANSEGIIYAGGRIRIINPNDLVARKLGRADMFRREYELQIPFEMSLGEMVERVNLLKQGLDFANSDPKDIARSVAYARMLADIADIRAIAENAKLDKGYIQTALKDFPTQDSRSMKDLLGKFLF